MKVVAVDARVAAVPLVSKFSTAHGALTTQRSVLVRVMNDQRVSGWGNVDPIPGYSRVGPDEVAQLIREILGPAVAGTDPLNVSRALHLMDGCLADAPEAKAAVEMALVDLKGKVLGVPACSLLGGCVRDEVRLNAWIGLEPADAAAALAVEWVKQGFRSAKIKVGREFRQDMDRVAAVRAAAGPRLKLRVDANESLDAEHAICLAKALEPYDISIFEQPVPRDDLVGLAEVRRSTRIPIMADESVRGPRSLIEIIRREAADFVKLKVMKEGGMLRSLQMVAIAEAAGLGVIVGHGFGLWMSTLAEAHVAAASLAIADGCESVGPLKMGGDVVKDPPQIRDGVLHIPSGPGLGAEPNESLLKEYGWEE